MALTKKQRELLKQKYDGKCAYCGCDLPERWHADHLEAVVRDPWGANKGRMQYPERHKIENMMPACPPCNISKHSMSLEGWRQWIAGHLNSLNNYHPIYRLAKAYGLVRETGIPVTFYFEKVSRPQPSPLAQKPNEQSIASAYESVERSEYASRDDA
ncbi:MAG TPA: HNH endonuclease signature motif containing protein [Methylophilaceae bacterium]|nr:HNH endonuclease signature motif containing protein [Methylophilaceae bacterium]